MKNLTLDARIKEYYRILATLRNRRARGENVSDQIEATRANLTIALGLKAKKAA